MASPASIKIGIRNSIMNAVDAGNTVDKSKLIAQLCLDTGYTDKVMIKIIGQLEELNYIKVEDNNITKND